MSNSALFAEVHQKLAIAQSAVAMKNGQACDEVCAKKCDKEADTMIRELSNPLYNITWNCKNNYDVYTTDYDPHHSWFDKISMDVMDVQKVMNKIQALEGRQLNDTDFAVLNELKKEMGIPLDTKVLPGENMNVREMLEEAVATHATPERSPGFIKAYGLENN